MGGIRHSSPITNQVNNSMKLHRQLGFTLIEVLIVVAIVGILAAIAYPSYVNQVNKIRHSDAQSALVELAARLQEYYIDQTPPTYAGASLDGNDAIFPNNVPLDSSDANKHYDLAFVTPPTANFFQIQANPTGAMEGDFTFSVDSRGAKQHFKGASTPIDGWP